MTSQYEGSSEEAADRAMSQLLNVPLRRRGDATVQPGMPRFGATDSTSQAAARECKRFLPAGGFFELVNRSQFQSSIPFRRGKGEYSRPAGHLSLGTAFYSLII